MKTQNERGAIMLEATYCIFVSIIILMFLISFGFLLYQKTAFRIAANEIAEEVAQTYKLRDTEDSSFIESDVISGIGKYRYFLFSGSFKRANEEKAVKLIEKRMDQTSLAKSESAYAVKVNPVVDDIGRRHFEITITKEYSFLLGGLLELIDQEERQQFETTVYVESMDVLNYVNTVKFTKYGIEKISESIGVLDMVDSAISLLHSIFG